MSETRGMGAEGTSREINECLPKNPEVGMRFTTRMHGMLVTFEIVSVIDNCVSGLKFIELVSQ